MPLDVSAVNNVGNSFTLVAGNVTTATFRSYTNGPGGFDQFWLKIPLGYAHGYTNYFDAGNANSRSIWNNNGLGGVTLSTGGTVPEPASWAPMIMGFGLVGIAARRRRSAVAA